MRKALVVVSTCLAVQFGVTSAYAAGDSPSVVDEIFESTFKKDDAEPEQPAPQIPASDRVVNSAGQGLVAPPPPVSAPAPRTIRMPTSGSAGEAKVGTSGASKEGDAPASTARQPEAPAPSAPEKAAVGTQGIRRVSSTAYCLTGTMASGQRVYNGAVAMNGTPIGSRYQVLDGPRAGETFTVADRIGYGSSFDIAYPGDCKGASSYGRRTISIRPV